MEQCLNRRCHRLSVFVLCVILSITGTSNGSCTFPSDIRGNWVSSDKGTLNFTETTLVDYPVNQITVSVNSLSFTCTEKSGDKYLLTSSETFVLFSLTFRAYLCFELHQISDYKYWYQIGNNIEPTNNERFLARPAISPVDITSGCDRTEPYETATFNTLVKQGAVDAGLAEATCPYPLLHRFSAGRLESADGTKNCTNVTVNMCNVRTRMEHTYDPSCDSTLKIASDGVSICLLDLTNETSGVTYLHVWNNDATLAAGVNQINCYAFTQSGDSFTGTLYPSSCTADQTDTNVTAPGISVYYDTIAETCQTVEESGPQTLYYVAIIVGALVLLFIIFLVICISVKTKCRCCRKLCHQKKKKIGHSDGSLSDSSTSGSGSGSRSIEDGLDTYTLSDRKDAIDDGTFKARKPIKLGPIIEPYLRPPPKVELLYDVEPPRPTSSKQLFDRALFMSTVSLKCKQ